MKRQEFDKVKPLEYRFKTAVETNYCGALTKNQRTLVTNLYNKYNKKNPVRNVNCNDCLLKVMKYLGAKYFKLKQKIEEDDRKAKSESEAERGEGNGSTGHTSAYSSKRDHK